MPTDSIYLLGIKSDPHGIYGVLVCTLFYREEGINQFDGRCQNILERIKTSSQMEQNKGSESNIRFHFIQISKMKLHKS